MRIIDRKNEGYLTSRIVVAARLTSRMSSVKSALESYPSIRPIGEGTSLAYLLNDNETKDHFYSIEFAKDCITLNIYSKQTPVLFFQEALLRLLSLAQITAKYYEVSVSSLYPYLVIAIAGQQAISLMRPERGKMEKREEVADQILSKRLIYLGKENGELKEKNRRVIEKLRRVILKAVITTSVGDSSIESIARNLGLGKVEVLDALSDAKELGYKAIYANKDRFSLVRL